jgi:hypothetical protein
MGYIEVYTANTNGNWEYRAGGWGPINYTFPGNQYGSTHNHEWIFTRFTGDDGDQEYTGYSGTYGGVTVGQVFQLNQTITIYSTDWEYYYYRGDFYFSIHNLRTTASTITYLGNGATEGSTASNTATPGNTFTFQANGFTKTGYSFNAWELTDSNNYIIGYYSQGLSYGIWDKTGNYTAKAQWTPETYTITYEANGVNGDTSGTMTNSTATYDSSFTFKTNGFTRTGYDFYRWDLYNSNNIYQITYSAGTTITWTITGNYTAKASWSAKTYTITYDANGGSGTLATNPQTATYDSSFTFQAANGFTRTGYAFFKWDLYESNGTTRLNKEYNSGQSYGTWDIPYNIIAKATWNVDSYTVTFDRNGKGTGKTVTQSVGTTVTCPILKAVGYVFGGWAISSTSTTVNKEGNATFVLGTANQSFFAIWTENTNGSVSFSELQTVYGGINPIGISEYRTESGQTTANSQIALSANFKGKGPAP